MWRLPNGGVGLLPPGLLACTLAALSLTSQVRSVDAGKPKSGDHHRDLWSPRPAIYTVNAGDGSTHDTLYATDGPVHTLVGRAGMEKVASSPDTIWLVDYFSTGCPHCWYFAPTMVQIAKAYTGRPNLAIGAFNCIDSVNSEPCKEGNGFPALVVWNYPKAGEKLIVPIRPDPVKKEDVVLSAKEVADWLTKNANLAPVHPEVLDGGPSSGQSTVVPPAGPPARSGWMHEEAAFVGVRQHEALVGLTLLLQGTSVNDEVRQTALKVVEIVAKLFPIASNKLEGLKAQLGSPDASEPAKYKQILEDFGSQLPSVRRLQSGALASNLMLCGSKPCAMWQLFHVLTVSLSSKAHSGGAPVTVEDLMTTMKTAVQTFFECAPCKQHFVQSYDNCHYGRCEVLTKPSEAARAKAFVLWLWRMHNAVSLRVISQHPPAESLGPLDRRWPGYMQCPRCWRQEVVQGEKKGEVKHYEGEKENPNPWHDVFNEESVYQMVMAAYGPKDNGDLVDKTVSQYAVTDGRRPVISSDTPKVLPSISMMAALSFSCCGLCWLVAIAGYCRKHRHDKNALPAAGDLSSESEPDLE